MKRYMLILFTMVMMIVFAQNTSAQFETDTSQDRNPEYLATAEELANDLKNRLTLNDEQTNEIKEILVDYQQDVKSQSETGEADPSIDTETESDFETDTETETETETQWDTTSAPDMQTDTSVTQEDSWPTEENEMDTPEDITDENSNRAQEKANDAIEQVLNETQRTTWTVIREAWWRDVNTRFGWDQNKGME